MIHARGLACGLGWAALWTGLGLGRIAVAGDAPNSSPQRFAYPAVGDRYGVIAPWYKGQNGQCDFRVRVAAETLKRYPWAEPPLAVMAAPHFVFNGHWRIAPDGAISVDPNLPDWHNGDVGQRSAALLTGLVGYYRYTGDPAAIGLIDLTAEYVIDYCQTPADHAWPGFFISCPTKGRAYGRADPHGFIQLDVSAQVGSSLVAAYKLTGNGRFLDAVKRWADLLARHCDLRPGAMPWNRYANPEDSTRWSDTRMTGGIVLVLQFLDDVIRLGHRGDGDCLIKARDAGDRYLTETLLPEWSQDPTWGHHFWDWLNPVCTCSVPIYASHYMMGRPEAFPAWKTDVRNLISLFFARSSVDPRSAGDVYCGAWACPESSDCCRTSLQYTTQAIAGTLARYGVLTGDAWAQEVARRQSLLSTYDAHDNGVVEDNVNGGQIVTGGWFNLAHPWPLRCVLEMLAWQPELLGAARDNHIVRSTSVVQNVVYEKGRIAYRTFDAAAPCEDVLRLAFVPNRVLAEGKPLAERQRLSAGSYTAKRLANGDCLLTIRHDGCRNVVVEGDDPQQQAAPGDLIDFHGNQVRLLGDVGPEGGRADVYLDGVRQLCGVDFWCPQTRQRQVVWYKNGLPQGRHTLKTVALGTKNPRSAGTSVRLSGVQWSAAEGTSGFGEGLGPSGPQRVIFGYVGRKDYCDSRQQPWRPATEFVLRLHKKADLVPISFWSEPQLADVAGTSDPELYRYGVFGRDFTAYFTVAPLESYFVRLKFCQARAPRGPGGYATNIDLQGKGVVNDMDIAATAGGTAKAVDLVFNDVRPVHGVIAVRFWHRWNGQAMVQAIEMGPGRCPPGAKPVKFAFPAGMNLLIDPGFEECMPGIKEQRSKKQELDNASGWSYRFLSTAPAAAWPKPDAASQRQPAPSRPRSGDDALCMHAKAGPAHIQVFQDVRAHPQTGYRASVWVQAADVQGKGFGTSPTDSAGLILAELDAAGRVLVTHPKVSLTKACDYAELCSEIVTHQRAAAVRFLLDTQIGCAWDEGYVTYDDSSFAQKPAADQKPY